MNRNHGNYWIGEFISRASTMPDTNLWKLNAEGAYRLTLRTAMPTEDEYADPAYTIDHEIYIFKPVLAGERWEILVTAHTDKPVHEAFKRELDILACTLGTEVINVDKRD